MPLCGQVFSSVLTYIYHGATLDGMETRRAIGVKLPEDLLAQINAYRRVSAVRPTRTAMIEAGLRMVIAAYEAREGKLVVNHEDQMPD